MEFGNEYWEEMGEGVGPGGLQWSVAGMYLHALIQGVFCFVLFFTQFRTTAVGLLKCWK